MIDWTLFLLEWGVDEMVGDYYNNTTIPYNPFQKEKSE